MYLPNGYGDPVKEYWKLVKDVTLWDVSVERVVEISGAGYAPEGGFAVDGCTREPAAAGDLLELLGHDVAGAAVAL